MSRVIFGYLSYLFIYIIHKPKSKITHHIQAMILIEDGLNKDKYQLTCLVY